MKRNAPLCSGCKEFWAPREDGFCSVCKRALLFAHSRNPDAPPVDVDNIPSLVKFMKCVESSVADERKKEIKKRCMERIERLFLRSRTREPICALLVLCEPYHVWSFKNLFLVSKKMYGLFAEEAKQILQYFAEHFSHVPDASLAFQCQIAGLVCDRFNLREIIQSPQNVQSRFPISGVVDCYYGSDDILETRGEYLNQHAQSLWNQWCNQTNQSNNIAVYPKNFFGVMCIWQASKVQGIPKDIFQMIVSYIMPPHWHAYTERSKMIMDLIK